MRSRRLEFTFALFVAASVATAARAPSGATVPALPTSPASGAIGPEGFANDYCPGAQAVTIGSVTYDSTGASSLDDTAPFCGTSTYGPGVWFEVIGNGTTLTASTCETVGNPPGASSMDTKVFVYCQGCSTLSCVGGNDDVPGCNQHSAVSWCSQPGAPYLILVMSADHNGGFVLGPFVLGVSSNGQSCTATVDCSSVHGACCVTREPPFQLNERPVSCSNLQEADCAAAGGAWQGAFGPCTAPVEGASFVVNPSFPIPDGVVSGVSSTIHVPGAFVVQDVDVDLGVQHTSDQDLYVQISGPTGLTRVLWKQLCFNGQGIHATFDDSAGVPFCFQVASGPIDQVRVPPVLSGDGPLSIFNGTQAQGDWTLTVSDYQPEHVGTLDQWSLHFLEQAPVCPPFECPPPPAPGAGGCPDDEDEDSDGSHVTVEVEGAGAAGTPVEIRSSGSDASPSRRRPGRR